MHLNGKKLEDNNGGIQWIDDDEVVVHYSDNLLQYAISISDIDPSVCGFKISSETMALHSLSVTSPSAPIISLSIGK